MQSQHFTHDSCNIECPLCPTVSVVDLLVCTSVHGAYGVLQCLMVSVVDLLVCTVSRVSTVSMVSYALT